MEEYTDAITKLNTNDQFRQIMTLEEENAKMDRSNLKRAEEKGFEEGKSIGVEEGINIGANRGQVSLIKKMISKGKTIEEISDLLDIPIEEINNLLNIQE